MMKTSSLSSWGLCVSKEKNSTLLYKLFSKLKIMIKVKQLVHSHLQNNERLSQPDVQAKICLAFIALGSISLILSLLSIHTIVSLGIVILGLALLLKKKLHDIQEKGIISYIPLKFHKVLLHRSLFDILCDIWFIPRLTIYIKAFIGPFIYRIKPEEAIHNLEELDPGVKKALLTKGLIYLFPKSLRKFLLPKKNHMHRMKVRLIMLIIFYLILKYIKIKFKKYALKIN
jgi:hypothetical protein